MSDLAHVVAPPSEEERERRTSYLELFFDLVFVFAITEVASLMSADPTAAGYARAALVLWLVWWAWGGYAWMTNAVSIDDVRVRVAFLLVTVGCFFVALGVPDAYGEDALWFGVPYLAVRAAHVVLYVWGLRLAPEHQAAMRKLAPWFLVAPALVVLGSLLDGNWRTGAWLLAAAVDVAGALNVRNEGFRVSAAHFAERYGLFVIIALGESIVATGAGAASTPRNGLFAVTVVLALTVAALLWWAYFDFLASAAERTLRRRPIDRRGPLARDIFSFFHFPYVLGIVLYAVAAKTALHHPADPLTPAGRWALGTGVAVYLAGTVLARLRAVHRVAWERALGGGASLAAAALLGDVDAVWLLAVSAGILGVVVTVESARLRELRRSLVAAGEA